MADSIKNERTIDAEGLGEEAGKLAPKVLHAGPEPTGQPYVLVSEDGIQLVGNDKQVISVSDVFGIGLSGPISLSAMPDNVSFGGGYWRIDERVLSTLPSTSPTPIPWLKKATPKLLASSKDLKSIVSDLESGLGF